jgi:hypothetical protein
MNVDFLRIIVPVNNSSFVFEELLCTCIDLLWKVYCASCFTQDYDDASDYIEKAAMSLGLEKLFLLTTRTADWYATLSFSWSIIWVVSYA